jgi:PEP-CTERM motif
MKRRVLLISAMLTLVPGLARADAIAIGLLSFDVFISASITPPILGTNAFDIFNFTGPTFGGFLGSPFASDPLTFENALLTVTPESGSPQAFNLGKIGPGELLDASGNPLVQFPAVDNFTSAIFTATLSPAVFPLSDGSTFEASGFISASLTPLSGPLLQAGTDSVVIDAQLLQAPPIPEPSAFALLGTALAGMFGVFARKRRNWRD